MDTITASSSGALYALAFATVLSACGRQAAPEAPVVWHVSWQPPTVHTDNTPIVTRPTYELEMAPQDEEAQQWKVVWAGQATSAEFKGPPGRYCFRAITVEKGVRSPASPPVCATKQAGEGAATPVGSSRS